MLNISPEVFGWVSLGVAVVGYAPYFKSIYAGKTKPHAFSWFIWGLLTTIAFFAQVTGGAGAGSWAMGFSAAMILCIAVLSLFKGEKEITTSDWIVFLSALAAIPVWYLTKDPLYAVILITAIDTLGFWPTFRKSWGKPQEEPPIFYIISSTKFTLALLALENMNWTTALYPLSLVIMNLAFLLMIIYRKRALALV
jgi:hypothetical protein